MAVLLGAIVFLVALIVLRQRLQLPNPGHVIGPEHLRPSILEAAADARRAVLDSVLADYVSNLRQGDVDDSGYHRRRLEDALNQGSFTKHPLNSWKGFSDLNWQLQPYGLRAVDPDEYEQLTGVKLPPFQKNQTPTGFRGVLARE